MTFSAPKSPCMVCYVAQPHGHPRFLLYELERNRFSYSMHQNLNFMDSVLTLYKSLCYEKSLTLIMKSQHEYQCCQVTVGKHGEIKFKVSYWRAMGHFTDTSVFKCFLVIKEEVFVFLYMQMTGCQTTFINCLTPPEAETIKLIKCIILVLVEVFKQA